MSRSDDGAGGARSKGAGVHAERVRLRRCAPRDGFQQRWVGPTGPGQVGADGLRDTSLVESPADAPPEQSSGGEEPNRTSRAEGGLPRRTPITRTSPTSPTDDTGRPTVCTWRTSSRSPVV